MLSQARAIAVVLALLSSTACISGTSRAFRVLPASPDYLLRYPNSKVATFSDVLRLYNGFKPGDGSMFLRSGMELRVENAYYKPGSSKRGLEGFLGTEVARYRMRPNGELELLSVQSMKDRPSDDVPVERLISGVQTRCRYHRFYYEIFFRKAGESRGSVLLGANSSDELTSLAAQLLSDPESVCRHGSEQCTVFPEACSVSVEIQIVVDGKATTVPWSSTLSAVAEHTGTLKLFRVNNGRLLPVEFDARDDEALELPLLPGDHVTSQ
ncbi:MAG: hypothetical protein JOY62_07685 [Acidobacteriaceae bacterium]|nr:hypothetical protein [Acidobacteriaceae bacterium]MBV9779840.1 hypothetical protein [Acidobacteriaceae bacterium]